MKQVNVSINGRSYGLNCGEGEEQKLYEVVEHLNKKISQLDKITKQSGDTNLMLAAALLASSEALDLERKQAAQAQELTETKQLLAQKESLVAKNEAEAQAALMKMTQRIENLTTLIAEQLSAEQLSAEQLSDSPANKGHNKEESIPIPQAKLA